MSSALVIDVSNTNPIGEQTLRRSGAAALIAKATEGTSFEDVTYPSHRAAAQSAGVPFGAYLFLHPYSQGSEAEFFLAYAKPRAGDLQPIIDCEVTDGAPMAVVAERCQACAAVLQKAGYRPILYSNLSFLRSLIMLQPKLKGLRLWEAQYPGRLTTWSPALAKLRISVASGVTVCLWQWTQTYAAGGRSYDASRLLAPLNSLLIPKAKAP